MDTTTQYCERPGCGLPASPVEANGFCSTECASLWDRPLCLKCGSLVDDRSEPYDPIRSYLLCDPCREP